MGALGEGGLLTPAAGQRLGQTPNKQHAEQEFVLPDVQVIAGMHKQRRLWVRCSRGLRRQRRGRRAAMAATAGSWTGCTVQGAGPIAAFINERGFRVVNAYLSVWDCDVSRQSSSLHGGRAMYRGSRLRASLCIAHQYKFGIFGCFWAVGACNCLPLRGVPACMALNSINAAAGSVFANPR